MIIERDPAGVRIDPELRVWLISDLHIGDGSASEPFAHKDELLRRFFAAAARGADALVINGDGFDLAQAWRLERIYAAHGPLLDDLAHLAQSMPVYYVHGNHEGRDPGLAELLPLKTCKNLRIGPKVLVEHGHVFDPYNQPGDRAAFWGSRVHALVERLLRAPIRIPMHKHYGWSTRVGHWSFYHYGLLRFAAARLGMRLGWDEPHRRCTAFLDYWGRGEWGDCSGLLRAADLFLGGTEVETLVCGHSHSPGKVELPGGTYVNTGSWTYGESTYVRYQDGEFSVRRWPDDHEHRGEEYRGALDANREKSFFDWWATYYRGWFRYDLEAMQRRLVEPAADTLGP